jgi:hypothetical protein
MRRALSLHPDSRAPAVRRVEVEVARPRASALLLRYIVSGDMAALALPAVTAPARTDELWRHTCFEVFLRPSASALYYEFNFAPSTQWAGYRFDSYRSGMRATEVVGAPRIEVERAAERFALQVTLHWNQSSELARAEPWRLGLSAVLEAVDGGKSYWAVAHPPGQPDFHHADCFALELQ